jgi:DNA-directed RNA polymerase subunit beta'
MNELASIFGQVKNTQNFDRIQISIASPEQIRSWSYGEVKEPETINYRTFKPEKNGLFCARIFGPVKDYECLCGKYKRMKYKGIICEKCGVEVTLTKVRRERMAHIELAAPVSHIWFMRSLPSRISMLLGMKMKDLQAVLYFDKYIVTEPGMTGLEMNQMLNEEEYLDAVDEYGEENFRAGIGAEAVKEMLAQLNLEELAAQLRVDLKETGSKSKRKKFRKRLKLVEAFMESGTRPEWMVLDIVPVIPPELRPLVPLDGGRFATSDLNDLYRRVINRNNRLRRLIELRAPDIIIRNEKRMLQESVDALFDNGRGGRTITGANRRPLKSLSDMLKGKQGRFRQNLLGKRVDYSGRSVIVVGPSLKLHECGLPKKMALELFKPFIYHKLESYGHASTIKAAKKLVEKKRPEVWDILEEVIKEHPVLLNRAPTLHRLGIQAFEPVLIEGKAIQLHPLVCPAFNADFDGDQMAVHVPLSTEAQLESRALMMSTNNILSPASGKPIIVPSQDIVLGIYWLSLQFDDQPGEGSMMRDMGEIEYALDTGSVTLHSKIKARYQNLDEDGSMVTHIVETTPGRMKLAELLPKHPQVPFSLVNRILKKGEISEVIDTVYRHCGQKTTVIFCDKLMTLGFGHAGKAGISFGKDDMTIPDAKKKLVDDAQNKIREYEQQYLDGLITQGEKHNKAVDVWTTCTNEVADALMDTMSANKENENINSIFMMADSGARGSKTQIRQLAGMRGLMQKPSGDIIESPITSSFKDGLSVLEYFTSSHGARKGLADTALKTANSGYLTRRLCDVAMDVTVVAEDCETDKSMKVEAVVDGGDVIVPLADRILGRTVAEDIIDPVNDEVIAKRNDQIDENMAEEIERAGIDTIQVRSPLMCEQSGAGICAACYGRDLSRGTKVNVGEAVGVIAAQSIGEPGTQLTMRTFHIGGAAQGSAEQSTIEASHNGTVKFRNLNKVTDSTGTNIVMGRNTELLILDDNEVEKAKFRLVYGCKLLVNEGDEVKLGQKLAEWDPYTLPIITEKDGVVQYKDLKDGISIKSVTDESTGISSKVVTNWRNQPKGGDLNPRLELVDADGEPIELASGSQAIYRLLPDAIMNVKDGQEVKAGDVLARLPRETAQSRDITGGLPRVAELFEARKPKDAAVIAAIEGTIEFGKVYKTKRRIIINPADEDQDPVKYMVRKDKHIVLNEGDYVRKGDRIVDGSLVPHDILDVMGVEALAQYLINEVQDVYRLQGVKIDDKHLEVVFRQMLRKVQITDPGDTTLIRKEQIDRIEFDEENQRVEAEGGQPAEGKPVLQGITKAALKTRSWISAASFQETTRVLTEASVKGKIDHLDGFKENVIVGRLIPAGTGHTVRRIKRQAAEEDRRIRKQRAELEAAAAEEQEVEAIEQASDAA